MLPADFLKDKDWVELTVSSSTIAWFWADVPGLMVIAFNFLGWTEAP